MNNRPTLGQVFGKDWISVEFNMSSMLARIDDSDIHTGHDRFLFHLNAGNIVFVWHQRSHPSLPEYKVAKPDAPAIQ